MQFSRMLVPLQLYHLGFSRPYFTQNWKTLKKKLHVLVISKSWSGRCMNMPWNPNIFIFSNIVCSECIIQSRLLRNLFQGSRKHMIVAGVSKRSTVALLCYFLPRWCYFSFLVTKGAVWCATHGATATVTCATAKLSLDTPVVDCVEHRFCMKLCVKFRTKLLRKWHFRGRFQTLVCT